MDRQEVREMTTSDNYTVAPDGEIVKMIDGRMEYTGMYVLD
jgi:hypothetical protein